MKSAGEKKKDWKRLFRNLACVAVGFGSVIFWVTQPLLRGSGPQPTPLIEVDLETKSLNVHLTDAEITQRLEALPAFEPQVESRWLRRYSNAVTSASTGAVLG